jgi:hypothetical protein
METHPPRLIERLVSRLIPASCREHIVGDLRERSQSTPQYLLFAIRTLPIVVVGRMKRTFDPAFLVVELCGLFVAFEAAWRLSDMPLLGNVSQIVRLVIPALAGLLGLLVRDAYVDREDRNPLRSVIDAGFGAAVALVMELLLAGVLPAWSLPAQVILKAALMAVFILSLVRMSPWMVMRPVREPESLAAAVLQFQKRIRHRNIREYVGAGFVVSVFGVNAVRAVNPATRVALFMIVALTVYTICRLHRKGWVRTVSSNLSSAEYREIYRRELDRQRELLQGAWKGLTIISVPLIALFFVVPAPAAARLEIPMMMLPLYIFTFVLIGKLNRIAARRLAQRIQTLDN